LSYEVLRWRRRFALYFRNKPPKKYVADSLAAKYGHKVLRLPPYHCIFNPIELIWGISKTFYSKHVGRDGYGGQNAVKIWKEAVAHVTPTMWNNSVEHVNKIIKTWWERELICDRDEVAPLLINIGEDSADSCSDSIDQDETNESCISGISPL
jgi:hypothetical protein